MNFEQSVFRTNKRSGSLDQQAVRFACRVEFAVGTSHWRSHMTAMSNHVGWFKVQDHNNCSWRRWLQESARACPRARLRVERRRRARMFACAWFACARARPCVPGRLRSRARTPRALARARARAVRRMPRARFARSRACACVGFRARAPARGRARSRARASASLVLHRLSYRSLFCSTRGRK